MPSSWLRRAAVLGAVFAAALVLGAVGLNTAAAQEPDEAVAEVTASRPQPGDTMTTVLQPGDNLVGWIEGTTPVTELFDAVAEIETVWAWDALRRQWLAASRRVPSELHTLRTLESGMGLLVQVGGNEPVEWLRSAYPARGLVELYPGDNLVAWSGRDGSAMDYLALGIGSSLVEAWVWDVERSGHRLYNSANPESAEGLQAFDRGDAVWINVSHAVNWLQPTGVLPRIEFPGGASDTIRETTRTLLASVVDFFGERYGTQADPSELIIVLPANGDAFHRSAPQLLGETYATEAIALATWGWAPAWALRTESGTAAIVARQPSTDREDWSVLAHEYTHALQIQMVNDGLQDMPQWLVEGSAEWAADEYLISVVPKSRHDPHRRRADYAREEDHPQLGELEEYGWLCSGLPYQDGWQAISQLSARADQDSWLDFWRHLAPSKAGPHQRWFSAPRWQDALHEVFGMTATAVYAAFDAWVSERAEQDLASDTSLRRVQIRGQVVDSTGDPVQGLRVGAIRISSDRVGEQYNVGSARPAETGPDGQFRLEVMAGHEYRLPVYLGDDRCTAYYRGGGLTRNLEEASPIRVGEANLNGLRIRIPENLCRQIRGVVAGPDGIGVPGIRLHLWGPSGDVRKTSYRTAADGSFAATVRAEGEYHVSVELNDHCQVYYRTDGALATGHFTQGSPVSVTDRDVEGVRIETPRDVCAWQIRGHVVDSSGVGLPHSYVGNLRTSLDGSFTYTVPEPGFHTLSIRLVNGCSFKYAEGGIAVSWDEASAIGVLDSDVDGVRVQVPEDACVYQIRGRIVGRGRVGGERSAYVVTDHAAGAGAGEGAAWATTDGSFVLTVPTKGRYRLRALLGDDCWVHYTEDGSTADVEAASWITIGSAGIVDGVVFQVSDNPCG